MKTIFLFLLTFTSTLFAQQKESQSPIIINVSDLNTSYDEISVSTTADGAQLFFSSNKPKSSSNQTKDFDLYSAIPKNNSWNKISNLSSINTVNNELISSIHYSGEQIAYQNNASDLYSKYLDFSTSIIYFCSFG